MAARAKKKSAEALSDSVAQALIAEVRQLAMLLDRLLVEKHKPAPPCDWRAACRVVRDGYVYRVESPTGAYHLYTGGWATAEPGMPSPVAGYGIKENAERLLAACMVEPKDLIK